MIKKTVLIILMIIFISNLGVAADTDLEQWLVKESKISISKLIQNISPYGAKQGVVLASPSKTDPDYYYHWVRDAALTMNSVVTLYKKSNDKKFLKLIFDYVNFSRENQLTQTLTGLGEPKFYVNGNPYNEPWGRPQNDGPALRAITLINFANLLLENQQNGEEYVRSFLYDSRLPTGSVIKADLEYVSHNWQNSSFDLWEEVNAKHFYTLMAQRKALILGAKLAQKLNDIHAMEWYYLQSKGIESFLNEFRTSSGQINASKSFVSGTNYKNSNLDISVILGVLHGSIDDNFFDLLDADVLRTGELLELEFKKRFKINNLLDYPLIGRYPEDQYYGGNPWYLTTFAMGEFYYKAAKLLKSRKLILINEKNVQFFTNLLKKNNLRYNFKIGMNVTEKSDAFNTIYRALINNGDRVVNVIRKFVPSNGELSEQISQVDGAPLSAVNLTWSYASFLTLFWEKN